MEISKFFPDLKLLSGTLVKDVPLHNTDFENSVTLNIFNTRKSH